MALQPILYLSTDPIRPSFLLSPPPPLPVIGSQTKNSHNDIDFRSDESDDDEDDEAALILELEQIRKERTEEKLGEATGRKKRVLRCYLLAGQIKGNAMYCFLVLCFQAS
ncbi:hypothetical protein CIPAW_11G206500 [Carya illinoinensis]|uniref:Uncharacterized protein n=1 Tax=Carya illinoinensis TaxID=32201 RepID=A0A8T1P815_CARIL|nr:hypothetical protein CIPAW_11G206500 [Carya illinoinensis]